MTGHDPLHTCADCGHRIRLDVEQIIRADERERIAQAIEAKADDLPIENYVLPDCVDTWRQARADLHDAARIAREGGTP